MAKNRNTKNRKAKQKPTNESVVMELSREQWECICAANAKWELLEVVEDQGVQAAWEFVNSLEKSAQKPPGSL